MSHSFMLWYRRKLVNKEKCKTNRQIRHYNSIDGLRALSCLGIIVMHIEANKKYQLGGSAVCDQYIPSLTW